MSAPNVARAFAERVGRRELGQDLRLVYRVVGGMPSQRVDYTIAVDAVGGASVTAYDARVSRIRQERAIPVERLDVVRLFEQACAGLHSLVPSSQAEFLPDALVGSLTIEVGGQEETFYFTPEEEQRTRLHGRVAPSMEQVLRQLWTMAAEVSR